MPANLSTLSRKEDPLGLPVCMRSQVLAQPVLLAREGHNDAQQQALHAACLQQTAISGANTSTCIYLASACLQQFHRLAEGLPHSKHEHSRLICPVTLEVMNEHNPPMVASNGAVYSEKAVQQIAAQNDGKFKNPQTGM